MTAFDSFPELTEPVMVAAFEGWNDAGDAATGAVEHLELIWDAKPLAALDSEDYYDFQVNRPQVSLVDGVTRRITWPATRFSYARADDRDIVLLRGIEPSMRWRTFSDEILKVCRELDVRMVVWLGSLLADTPHTRPVRVTGSSYDSQSAARFSIEQSRYEGPTGIVGVLQDACVRGGIPAITFWAALPHYITQSPHPKATIALLQRVEEVLDIAVPLGGLPQQAQEWQRIVDEMAGEDEDITEYVRGLEARAGNELTQTSGETIAREFERYLRRRGQH